MFFKDLDEYKKYVDFTTGLDDFETIKPKLIETQRDILNRHFSKSFIDDLYHEYELANFDFTQLNLLQQQAISKLRAIQAPLSITLHITKGQVQIDNAGIYIVRNQNRATAFEWQINDLIKSYYKPGYQAIEDCIEFLNSNITDYPLYAQSDEYVYYKSVFIKNSKEFTRLYSPVNYSFMNFLKLRPLMDKAEELEIQNILLPDYYAELKANIINNALTVADKAILPYIKKAVANITASKAFSELSATLDHNGFMTFDSTGATNRENKKTAAAEHVIRAQTSLLSSGNSYLKSLKKFLEDHKNSYPTYTADDLYKADEASTVTNNDGQGFYNAL